MNREHFEKTYSMWLDELDVKPMPNISDYILGPTVKPECKAVPKAPAAEKKRQKMSRYYDEYNDEYVDALPTQSDTAVARNHLASRVRELNYPKLDEFRKQFELDGDDAPTTAGELIDRFKKGRFTIKEGYTEDSKVWSPMHVIVWRDPKSKPDEAGFKKASEDFSKAMADTLDEIMVKPPEDGLKSLRKLEAFKA